MPVDLISNSSVCLSCSQSAILLQEVGALYMALKAASGGATFAQFACQRVLPALGLLAHEIEGIPVAVFLSSAAKRSCFSPALVPMLLGDDPKVVGPAIVAISRARRTPS